MTNQPAFMFDLMGTLIGADRRGIFRVDGVNRLDELVEKGKLGIFSTGTDDEIKYGMQQGNIDTFQFGHPELIVSTRRFGKTQKDVQAFRDLCDYLKSECGVDPQSYVDDDLKNVLAAMESRGFRNVYHKLTGSRLPEEHDGYTTISNFKDMKEFRM